MRIDLVDVYTPGANVTCYCYLAKFKAPYPSDHIEALKISVHSIQAVVLSFLPIGGCRSDSQGTNRPGQVWETLAAAFSSISILKDHRCCISFIADSRSPTTAPRSLYNKSSIP
jgi:hypothetical protein